MKSEAATAAIQACSLLKFISASEKHIAFILFQESITDGKLTKTKLRGLSQQTNHTDRMTASCRWN
jgi:hypothetical protein